MKKVILKLLLIIYILFIVLTTFLLLKQNEFKVSVINNKSVFVLNNDLYITKFKSKYEVNDKIYYSNKSGKIYSAKINAIKNNNYILDNNKSITKKNIVGTNDYFKIPLIGLLYKVFTMKYVYLIVVILPIFICFLYEIYQIIKEIKR